MTPSLRHPLPQWIEHLCDLNAGRGDLLLQVADRTTRHGLLLDAAYHQNAKVDRIRSPDLILERATSSLPDFYPLLREVDWQCDCFALSPVASAEWPVAAFAKLRESDSPGVRESLATVKQGTLDSQLATIMVALDRCSLRGEGVALVDAGWFKALQDRDDPILKHVWAVVEGGPDNLSAIYFARTHTEGIHHVYYDDPFETSLRRVNRIASRSGMSIIFSSNAHTDTVKGWDAVKREAHARTKPSRSDYHLWLDDKGRIRCQVSDFDTLSERISRGQMADLLQMHERTPAELVVQAHGRTQLVSAIKGGLWRVDPRLLPMVESLLEEQSRVCAPLYPLPDAMRLGWLDEQTHIKCRKTMVRDGSSIYQQGKTYPIACVPATVRRVKTKPNTSGEPDDWLLSGREMLCVVADETGQPWRFIDGRHLTDDVTITTPNNLTGAHYDLQTFIEHFTPPDVPDVAVTHAEQYQQNQSELSRLQEFINEYIS